MLIAPSTAVLALLQDGQAAEGGPPNMFVLLAGMFLIVWLVAIRPERKERKRKEAMIAALKKNDRVLTTSGLYATVAAVNESELTLKFDDGPTRVKAVRSAIAVVLDAHGKDASKSGGEAKAEGDGAAGGKS